MKPNPRSCKYSVSTSGFTLIEVLVVITIVIVLAALSFMGVRGLRQSAQATRCADNLRTWGTALQGYAADNNGAVQWSGWASIGSDSRYYETYLGGNGVSATTTMDGRSVFHTQLHRRCPAQKWNRTGNGPVGYSMVRPNPKVPNVGSYNLGTASNPSQLLLMMDATVLTLNGPGDIAGATTSLISGETARHGHKVHALFGDGHVSSYQVGDLRNTPMLERWFTLR
jgi:prepilin-type N-terminal cleavage/methylation domain-containing protein/prepilin-type processing-associated H-X9-DG protein